MENDGSFDSYSSVFKQAGVTQETITYQMLAASLKQRVRHGLHGQIIPATAHAETALAIAPNTGGSAGGVFIYNDQGSITRQVGAKYGLA